MPPKLRSACKGDTHDQCEYKPVKARDGFLVGSRQEQAVDRDLKQRVQGTSFNCILEQQNFVLTGVCFVFVLYVLSETTFFFESISNFFADTPMPRQTKSWESFAETHSFLAKVCAPVLLIWVLLTLAQSVCPATLVYYGNCLCCPCKKRS